MTAQTPPPDPPTSSSRRQSLTKRVKTFVKRMLPSSVDFGRDSRMNGSIRTIEKEIIDLLAFEQIAGLMGTDDDFDEIRIRKALLRARIIGEICDGELTMKDIRRMEKQVRSFVMDVVRDHKLDVLEQPRTDSGESTGSIKKKLERMWSRVSLGAVST